MAQFVDSIWNETEDTSLPESANSLCAALGDLVFEDICAVCPAETEFLMASAADHCIKKYDEDIFHREHYSIFSDSYSQIGYDTAQESGALGFGTDDEKYWNRLTVEFSPPVQSPIPNLYSRFGHSSQPECEFWKTLLPQPLRCQTAATDGGTVRPHDKAFFNRLSRGRYLFFRYFVTGTTGDTCFSKVEMAVRRAEG